MEGGRRAAPMAISSAVQLLPILVAAVLVAPQRLSTTAAAADNRTHGGFSLRLVATSHDADDGGNMVNLTRHLRPVVRPTTRFAYSVVARFGTGSRKQQDYKLALDMADGLTWMRCKPCEPELRQDGPLYDPAQSRAYRAVAGTDPLCAPPNPGAHPTNDGKCAFHVPRAQGSLGTETISLGSSDPIRNFVFGCASTTSRFKTSGIFAGAMGLGRPVPASFLTQLADRVGSRFSYCLFIPDQTGRPHHGYLRFGEDIPADTRAPHYVHTAILPPHHAGESAYFVSLVGVSVNGARLEAVRASMFARRADGAGGCVVDAGTELTWVAPEAFEHIQAAMVQFMQQWGAERVQRDDFKLCFHKSERVTAHIPMITLHFDGADLHLQGKEIFMDVKLTGKNRDDTCFLMMPATGSRTVIGGSQQTDTRFVFNLHSSTLSFRPEKCRHDGENTPVSQLNGAY